MLLSRITLKRYYTKTLSRCLSSTRQPDIIQAGGLSTQELRQIPPPTQAGGSIKFVNPESLSKLLENSREYASAVVGTINKYPDVADAYKVFTKYCDKMGYSIDTMTPQVEAEMLADPEFHSKKQEVHRLMLECGMLEIIEKAPCNLDEKSTIETPQERVVSIVTSYGSDYIKRGDPSEMAIKKGFIQKWFEKVMSADKPNNENK